MSEDTLNVKQVVPRVPEEDLLDCVRPIAHMPKRPSYDITFHCFQRAEKRIKLIGTNDPLDFAREVAVSYVLLVAMRLGKRPEEILVTIDHIHYMYQQYGKSLTSLGSRLGALFHDKRWKATGQYVMSARKGRKGSVIAVWQFTSKGGAVWGTSLGG